VIAGFSDDQPLLRSRIPDVGLASAVFTEAVLVGFIFPSSAIRNLWMPLHRLVRDEARLAQMAAIFCADLSMLSKAETERIWLPFTVWLTAAPALLPPPAHRWWLATNIVGALALNHFIFTNW